MATSAADIEAAVSNHPVLLHKLTLMRQEGVPPREFRRLLKEVTYYVGYEATKNLTIEKVEIDTPIAKCSGFKLAENTAIIPILRAGLGMVDPMLELLPNAAVHHIGMYRNKASLLPVQYYNRLPKDQVAEVSIVMDPMIATAATIKAVVAVLKRWGTSKIIVVCCLASRAGLTALLEAHPDLTVHVAAIDETLSEEGMIVPGLGDAGDRQFLTPELDEVEMVANAEITRKRTLSASSELEALEQSPSKKR